MTTIINNKNSYKTTILLNCILLSSCVIHLVLISFCNGQLQFANHFDLELDGQLFCKRNISIDSRTDQNILLESPLSCQPIIHPEQNNNNTIVSNVKAVSPAIAFLGDLPLQSVGTFLLNRTTNQLDVFELFQFSNVSLRYRDSRNTIEVSSVDVNRIMELKVGMPQSIYSVLDNGITIIRSETVDKVLAFSLNFNTSLGSITMFVYASQQHANAKWNLTENNNDNNNAQKSFKLLPSDLTIFIAYQPLLLNTTTSQQPPSKTDVNNLEIVYNLNLIYLNNEIQEQTLQEELIGKQFKQTILLTKLNNPTTQTSYLSIPPTLNIDRKNQDDAIYQIITFPTLNATSNGSGGGAVKSLVEKVATSVESKLNVKIDSSLLNVKPIQIITPSSSVLDGSGVVLLGPFYFGLREEVGSKCYLEAICPKV
ncbi:hypothetical protein ABK040_011285 [Willaertia magna]